MEKKLRWGIIGAGTIAVNRTIPGLLQAPHAQLTAVMNTTMDKAESVRARFGALRAYDTVERLLLDDEVDAVYIATPVYLHTAQIRQAADHGKHILCEKPLGMDRTDAMQAVEYCREKGVCLSVGFMMRYGAHIRSMKRMIEDGQIGQVVSGNGRFSAWTPDTPGFWLHRRELAGGGPVMDMGIHFVDLAQYVTGMRITHVAAMQERITFSGEDYTTDDSSAVIARLENGAQFVIQTNFNIPESVSKWVLDFYGTEGRLLGDLVVNQLDGGELYALRLSAGDDPCAPPEAGIGKAKAVGAEFHDLYMQEIERFSLAVLEGRAPDIDAMDAVRAQCVIDAIGLSAQTGRTVKVAYPG